MTTPQWGDFSQGQVQTSAWDSLYLEVRRSAYRVGWVDRRIENLLATERALRGRDGAADATAAGGGHEGPDQDQLLREDREEAIRDVERELKWWLSESRSERRHLTKVSGDAIRAGLSQHVVTQLNTEKETVGRVLLAALNAVDLTEEQKIAAVAAMYAEVEKVGQERREAVVVGELLA